MHLLLFVGNRLLSHAFLVIHNWIRHRYCKRITANTSNNKIISIIQTEGSFLIIERSAFFFLIVLFHRYTSFWELKTKSSTTKLLFLTIGLEMNTPLTRAILWIKNSATKCHFLQSIGLEISHQHPFQLLFFLNCWYILSCNSCPGHFNLWRKFPSHPIFCPFLGNKHYPPPPPKPFLEAWT